MIPLGKLQEFGFSGEDKFPRQLKDDAVTLSLPSAMEHGVEPVIVEISHGVVIPLSAAGVHNGMIVNSDGLILHVGHRDAGDRSSPLEARFIKEIPYEIRVEAGRVMRRAVQVDPSLEEIWQPVSKVWLQWFPVRPNESRGVRVGIFTDARLAWESVAALIGQAADRSAGARVRVVVQTEQEFNKGWMGDEILVDEGLARKMACFAKMQRALRDPLFHPCSSFKVWHENRGRDVVKLVVVAPWGAGLDEVSSAGIEL